MALRAGSTRRVPENDTTIAYVQADGLVSFISKCHLIRITRTIFL